MSGLLPAGMRDQLPEDTQRDQCIVDTLVCHCAAYGYERLAPPFLEFADTLLSGPGEAQAGVVFRFPDPASSDLLGLRGDMTPQVARIAATRLAKVERPLRLCYAGPVLRTTAHWPRMRREIIQIGAELIGCDAILADVEVILIAAEALRALGLRKIGIDINHPPLISTLIEALGLPEEQRLAIFASLTDKDRAALAVAAAEHARYFVPLLDLAGSATPGAARLEALALPEAVKPLVDRLVEVTRMVLAEVPHGVGVTIDPTEWRGFEYHSGVCFSLFAVGIQGEIGNGGRYSIPRIGSDAPRAGGITCEPHSASLAVRRPNSDSLAGETATGFSLYADVLAPMVDVPPSPQRVFLPTGTPRGVGKKLQAQGNVTLYGLDAASNPEEEAHRLGCAMVWGSDGLRPVTPFEGGL